MNLGRDNPSTQQAERTTYRAVHEQWNIATRTVLGRIPAKVEGAERTARRIRAMLEFRVETSLGGRTTSGESS